MNKKLFLRLSGGLGNQMFQFAAAKAISYKQNRDLYVDTKSSFWFDKLYQRKFQLGRFSIDYIPFEINHYYDLSIIKIKKKLLHRTSPNPASDSNNLFFEDDNKDYYPLCQFNSYSNLWLSGYYQAYQYFDQYKSLIISMYRLQKPSAPRSRYFYDAIKSQNSASICLRFYEESSDPSAHSNDQGPFQFQSINNALQQIYTIDPNVNLYIFTTKSPEFLSYLDLNCNYSLVTPSQGFTDPFESLSLLSQCKYHIITNSSFYWWGAFLSQLANPMATVFATDNFVNSSSILPNWIKI